MGIPYRFDAVVVESGTAQVFAISWRTGMTIAYWQY